MSHFILQMLIQITLAFTKPIFYRYFYTSGVKLTVLVFWESMATFLGNLLLAVILERKEKWSLLEIKDIKYSILSSLFKGAISQNVYVWSFAFAPPKLAAMISITVPAVKYVLNVIVRKEKLSRSILCVVKVVSICVLPTAIAVIVFLFNGGSLAVDSESYTMDVIAGTLLCFVSSNLWAWFSNNIEEAFIEKLAYTYTLAALTSLPGAVGSMILSVCRYHDKEYYNLAVDSVILRVSIGLTVLLSLAATFATTWSVQEKGAAYVASFSNVPLFLDTIAAPLILNGGKIELGSTLSCGLLSVCLGAFYWATTMEKEAVVAAADDVERGIDQKHMDQKHMEIVVIPSSQEHPTSEAPMDVGIDVDANVPNTDEEHTDVDVADADANVNVEDVDNKNEHTAVAEAPRCTAIFIDDVDAGADAATLDANSTSYDHASTVEVSMESEKDQATEGTSDHEATEREDG